MYISGINWISVADPDPVFLGHPDPDSGKYRFRIRENTGSRSGFFFLKKTPVIQIFSLYTLSKIKFRQINFLSLILSVIRCLDLGKKMP